MLAQLAVISLRKTSSVKALGREVRAEGNRAGFGPPWLLLVPRGRSHCNPLSSKVPAVILPGSPVPLSGVPVWTGKFKEKSGPQEPAGAPRVCGVGTGITTTGQALCERPETRRQNRAVR